jgi:hypothetical protein
MLFVATVGTTITPTCSCSPSPRWSRAASPAAAAWRIDAYTGAIFSDLIATSSSRPPRHAPPGWPDRDKPARRRRRRGADGQYAFLLSRWACSGVVAGGRRPAATASVAEASACKGINLDFRRAPIFIGLFSGLVGLARP